MRRICSFADFYCLVGFLCACRAQWLSRIISCWRLSSAVKAQIQSVVNPIPSSNTKLNPWKDKNPSHRRYPWTFWARADWAEGEGAQQCGTVFQTDNQTTATYHYIFLFIDILFLNQTTKQENTFCRKTKNALWAVKIFRMITLSSEWAKMFRIALKWRNSPILSCLSIRTLQNLRV